MLTLRYKADTTVPVEVEGLTPSAVRGLSIAEIQRFDLFHGNRKVPLAELFGYATAIRSLSKGRSSYSMEPSHFQPVPANLVSAILDQKEAK